MRHTRRTHTSPVNPISRRRSSQNTSTIYAIEKCVSVKCIVGNVLIVSLILNFLLIHWAAQSFTHSIPTCTTISNEPNHPCNPDYLTKLIESNPMLQHNLQLNRIVPHSPRSGKLEHTLQQEVSASTTTGHSGNKLLSKQDLKIQTVAITPASNDMGSLNTHKRELSWSSPLSRTSISGNPNHRPNPTLYITESEHEIWFNNRLFVFEDKKVAFCVMEKNSCSMFKQIFKRIQGKKDYLDTDYTKIHYLPYRGLEDISFYDVKSLSKFLNNDEFYFATFVREPLERLVSGYIDKCDKKRGVNLCDYARWSPRFKKEYGEWGLGTRSSFTPPFEMWVDGLFHCPCWPETDWHFAPQFNFCNLFQYVDKYDVFRFENRTHRKVWMERAGLWDKYGKNGWKNARQNDGTSIVDYGPQSHSSTGSHKGGSKYIDMYKNVDPDILASIIDHYRNDYIIFGMQMADWVCDDAIPINDNVKRALRTLPRTSRPPCEQHNWLWERE